MHNSEHSRSAAKIRNTIIQPRQIVDYSTITFNEKRFLEEIIAPELTKYTREQQQLILQRFQIVVENRQLYHSDFPTDKEYDRELTTVEGVRKLADPTVMVRHFALGIISQDDKTLHESYEFYQPEIMNKMRDAINRKRTFAAIKPHLNTRETNGQELLTAIQINRGSNNTKLDTILTFLHNRLQHVPQDDDSLVARLNPRTIDLSRSFGLHGCCAFWGTGEQEEHYQLDLHSRYHSSVLYLADPEIGLLFLQKQKGNELNKPTGVVIAATLLGTESQAIKTPSSGQAKEHKYLLIDSIEAYRPHWDKRFPNNPLRNIQPDLWRRLCFSGIIGMAKDTGVDRIFYNDDFWNEGGNTFTSYFLQRVDAQKQTITFRKKGGRNYIPAKYDDQFGFFLDALIPNHLYENCHATRGSPDGSGTATGWVIKV